MYALLMLLLWILSITVVATFEEKYAPEFLDIVY